MDWERAWKWIERVGSVIGAVCAITITYYTVGIFYGWDKQHSPSGEVAATPSGAAMSTYWPLIVLGILAILTLATSWIMIFLRLWSKKQEERPFSARAGMLPIIEAEMNFSRLAQAAPWLEVYFTFFNGAGYIVRSISASGRITVSGQEFHGHIELNGDIFKFHPMDDFFRIGVKIPLSASEVEYITETIRRGNLLVGFPNAAISFQIDTPRAGTPFEAHLPPRLNFDPNNGRTEPFLPWQLSR
jgi:hypothetical protein